MSDRDALYLTDLGCCQPTRAITPQPKRHAWRVMDYETESISGQMLIAGEETDAPEITYPVKKRGWHSISIGIYPQHRAETSVEVKLTGDAASCILQLGGVWSGLPAHSQQGIHELYWKAADLTGQDLQISQVTTRVGSGDDPSSVRCNWALVAYIKLEPMSDEEVAALQTDRVQSDTRRLYAHNDAHGYLYLYGAVTEEAVTREIEPYRNTDFSRMYWECGGGHHLSYLGEAGTIAAWDGVEDFGRMGDRVHAESWRAWRDKGIDPFKVALEHTHEIGMEFHAAYRTAGFYYPPPLDHFNWGSIYQQRPDLHMIGKDGRQAPRLSYAFPDTRNFVINLLKEVAQYPIDGVCLLYNRRPPLVDYEPPLVNGFVQEYGEDPRQLPDDDDRWLRYRSIALTEFHRELRREMDMLAEEQGRSERIAISACVLNRRENYVNGLDVATWVREELVDTLLPYTDAPALDGVAEAWVDMGEMAYFVSLVEGSSCQMALNVMPRFMPPEDFRRKAATLYKANAEHLFFWDCAGAAGRANFSPSWNALRRLGHREEIEAWQAAGEPNLTKEPMSLQRLGDYELAYQTPG